MRTALALLLVLLAAPAFADTAQLTPSKDNTLYESATGAISNAMGPTMFAGRTAQASNFRRRALVHFDVAAAVPPGSTITGVTLTLSMSQAGSATEFPVELHRALADWGEGTSNAGASGGAGGAATVTDATWKHRFFNTVNWAALGGDFAPAASASQAVGLEGVYSWSGGTIVADVQSWLDAPGGNFGWLLLGNETSLQSVKRFDTREAAVGARPLLMIEYVPGGTPAGNATWGRIRALYR
jgi:hypothetical protein